ncbi:hypothetical protein CMQ_5925 [Grosmannia clavigera kw1407]|uniref:Cell wall proline rich protein n=1 Tax=Grosmannia clavigera (strain kw1407 / UAMH 11150) TaxID=655863 RepID=F0XIH8_GROCL|nr:uncharacterized protein CMQ_5925 [Grosmannia clavigera kw1407]EFX02564.1 hypothetical protein CMQ_5925 [Grosmannia clavigera kw1407]
MAAFLSHDSSPLAEVAPVNMAVAEDDFAERSSPRNIPPPVTIPPQSNDNLPPLSPQPFGALPIRPAGAGHRRGGSEFVGGNARSGDAFALISTSPTKSESSLTSPSLAPVPSSRGPPPNGPPPGRRGHAHRRSAAISIHDLSDMLIPTTPTHQTRGNSAPSSPLEFGPGLKAFAFPMATKSDDKLKPGPLPPVEVVKPNDVPPASLTPTFVFPDEPDQQSADFRASNRARVGFSDTLEFIPRPLSLVSNDTASTITARPMAGSSGTSGHSVSESISSVISLNSAGLTPIVRSTSSGTVPESRPSTAGAVLERSQSITADDPDSSLPRRRNSIPLLSSIPTDSELSADAATKGVAPRLPSPIKTPNKRWSFFGLDPFITIGNSSPTRPRAGAAEAVDGSAIADAADASFTGPVALATARSRSLDRDAVITSRPASVRTVSRKSSKKKKKAKSWGILTRKSKARRKTRRTPTPPPISQTAFSDDEESFEEQTFSGGTIDETTEVLAPPTVFVTPSYSPTDSDSTAEAWRLPPSPSYSMPDDDASFAMIDLDAALGPFNTPLPQNAEWEAAQRAGGMTKRQLHSAVGMTRFSGPGMHYSHRRAESAPEMPPFNRAGLPRFSSSGAMADVFEEDEEDDDDEGKGKRRQMLMTADSSDAGSVVYSASVGGSTPPWRPTRVTERTSSIDIRVTSTDGRAAADKGVDMSTAPSEDAISSAALSRRGSGLSVMSDDDKTQLSTGLKSEYSASSLHEGAKMEEGLRGPPFDVPDSGCDVTVESASDSTVHSIGRVRKGKDLAPVVVMIVSPLHLPPMSLAPVSPFSMPTTSTHPSPRSPMSLEANRVSTAPSSVTEDNFQSLLMGAPGPELRRSLDIPSLTPSLASSTSTTTRESGVPPSLHTAQGPQTRPFLPSREAERPASFTYTAFGRRRSSLASLHRLINTSHGERSKLSMEVPLDSSSMPETAEDAEKKRPKSSRSKRLSRMMQFWRSKGEAES